MGEERGMIDPSPVTPVEHLKARQELEESLPAEIFRAAAYDISRKLQNGGRRSFDIVAPNCDETLGSVLDKAAEMLKDHFEKAGWEVSWYRAYSWRRVVTFNLPGTRAKKRRIFKSIGIVTALIAAVVGGVIAYPRVKAKLSGGAVTAQKDGGELAALIKQGNLINGNSNITEANFPDVGIKTVFKIYQFDRTIDADDAAAAINKDGYRPANLRELVLYARTHWDGQDWVIAVGQRFRGSTPYLGRSWMGEREIDLESAISQPFKYDCRFLAVPK